MVPRARRNDLSLVGQPGPSPGVPRATSPPVIRTYSAVPSQGLVAELDGVHQIFQDDPFAVADSASSTFKRVTCVPQLEAQGREKEEL